MAYWNDDAPATEEDVKTIQTHLNNPFYYGGATGFSYPGFPMEVINRMLLDWRSMVGRHHPDYLVAGEKSEYGGTGSANYETQHVGDGVSFTKDKIWHFTENVGGELIKDVPGTLGEYHYSPKRGTQVAGPAPGSEAADLLGDSYYQWDEKHQWYVVAE